MSFRSLPFQCRLVEANNFTKALLASRNSADEHLQNILTYTRGILFLGTPHAGSGYARWAELMAKSIGLIKQTNHQILDVLKNDSEVLARIQTDFHTMARARAKNSDQPIGIICFYEELPLPGIGKASIPASFLMFIPVTLNELTLVLAMLTRTIGGCP